MAKYAYEKCEFYKKVRDDCRIKEGDKLCWEDIPIVNKTMIQTYNRNILSEDYLVKQYKNELISISTSGTTGTCLDVKWNVEDANRSLSSLWLSRYSNIKIKPHDKYCYFFSSRFADWKIERFSRINEYSLGIYSGNLTMEDFPEIYNTIVKFSPKWMILQPSMAALLCEAISKFSLPLLPELKYVELTGEIVMPELKKKIEEMFSCEVRIQYGSNEVFSIAYECEKGKLHCFESNVYVEVLDEKTMKNTEDGVEGDIYVTSLNNYAMPFIRYQLGDVGKIYHNYRCKCGKKGTIIYLSSTRKNDMISLKNGQKLSAYIFHRVVSSINEKLEHVICQYQVIQKQVNNFEVKFVLDKHTDFKEVIQMFLLELQEPLLEGATFRFYSKSYLEQQKETGKVRCFKNEVQ